MIGSFGMNMYNNMKLVQVAAEGLEEWNKDAVVAGLQKATFDGPSGPLATDPENQHMIQNAYIATIQPDKSFKLEETIENVTPQAGCTISSDRDRSDPGSQWTKPGQHSDLDRPRSGRDLRSAGRDQPRPCRPLHGWYVHPGAGAGRTGNFWLGVLAAPLVVGTIGLVVERGVVQWLRDRPLDTLLATLGVGIVIREGVKLLFGAGYRQVSNPLPGNVAVGPVTYPIYRLLLIAMTVAVLAALAVWLYRSTPGLRLRAMLQDRETAAAYGIDPGRASLFAFIVGAALAGLAGALMSPLVTVGPDVGMIYLARAFMVVVVGGVGSLLGLVGGGVIIGGGDALAGYFLNPTIANAAVLVLAVIILRFRPGGLFR